MRWGQLWWRLRALSWRGWRALREDRVFRLAAIGAVLALSLLMGRLSPLTKPAPMPGEAQETLLEADPALPARPPVLPPEALVGGAAAPAATATRGPPRIAPGQPLGAAAAPPMMPGDRFGTVAPQHPGPRP